MAYRAEIEIGVKGGSKIDALRDKVDQLTKAIDKINNERFSVAQRVSKLTSFQVAQEQKLISQRQRFNDELRESVRLAVEFQQRIEASVRAAQSSRAVSSRTLTGSTTAGLLAPSPERKALPAAGGTGAGARAFERAAAKAARIDAFTAQAAEFLRDIDRQIEQRSNAIRQARVSVGTGQPQPFGLLPPARTPAAQAIAGGSAVQQEVTAAKTVQNTLTKSLQIQQEINELKTQGIGLEKQLNELTRAKLDAEGNDLTLLNDQIARTRQLRRENQTNIKELKESLTNLPSGGFVRGAASPLRGDRELNANIRERTRLESSLTNFKLQGFKVTAAEVALEKLDLSLSKKDLNTTEQELKRQKELLKDLREELRLVRQISDNRNGGIDIRTGSKRAKDALGSALIGGAFPLLFGQGVGAAAGGLIGGGLGGLAGGQFGFALSLVGTQIGTAVDSLSLLGQELNSLNPDVGKISESLGIAGTETQQYIDALVAAGREQEAATFATSELAALIGNEGVNALKEFGADTQNLANEFTRAMTIMGAAIAEIINRAEFLKGITSEIERFTLASQAETSTDPEIQRLLERRRTETRTGPGGSGTDIVLFESLTEQIIERQRELNRLKREGLDIDGVAKLKTEQQGRTIQKNLDKSLNALEISRINAGLENEKVFELRLQGIELERNEAINANILALNNKQITRLQAIKNQTRINADAEAAINNLTNDRQKALDKLNQTGGGGTGADGEKIIQDLVRQTALQKELNILATEKPEDRIAEIRLEREEQLLRLQNSRLSTLDRIAEIADAELRARAESVELELTASRVKAINLKADTNIANEKDRQKNALEKNIRNIQNEIDLSKARLDGNEDQVKLEQQLQAIKESTGIKDAEALENLKQTLVLLQEQLASEKAIQEVRDIQQRTATAGAGLRAGFIGQAGQAFEQQLQKPGVTAERATEIALLTQEMELAELQAQSLQNVVLGIGDAFATAMTTGVAELIDGTKSAEEVFSDFLKNVGNTLLQAAQQMIATYIAIGIARAFAGLAGGSKPDIHGANVTEVLNAGDLYNPSSSVFASPLANGGPAKAGQPYMVGERGPELFVPSSNGGVMRNEDMRQLMGRSPASNVPAMNFTFETTNIGGQEFVSREQLEAAMATTRRQAANDGAKRGMNMTLDRMQNSPRTRARVGIS